MELIDKIGTMHEIVLATKQKRETIGLVPTMGFLHEGHLSLVKKSVEMNDRTCVSIFVNPTQFGPQEDFTIYPRDLGKDLSLLNDYGVDWVFRPFKEEMYPPDFAVYVDVERFGDVLCGKSRPGHFRGVTTIVNKLFNIVKPNHAYFGQKDGQQLLIIKKMVADLNMGVEIVSCPTIREKDGLAMSSRNKYLSSQEREAALVLYKALEILAKEVEIGIKDAKRLKVLVEDIIKEEPLARLDYFSIVDKKTLKEVDVVKGSVMAALAVYVGKTRLIDNIWLEV